LRLQLVRFAYRVTVLRPEGFELGFGALLRTVDVFANGRSNDFCSLVDRGVLGVIVFHS
jgi:hypothetical protein